MGTYLAVRTLRTPDLGALGEVLAFEGEVLALTEYEGERAAQIHVSRSNGEDSAMCFVVIPDRETWTTGSRVFVLGLVIDHGEYETVLGATLNAYVLQAQARPAEIHRGAP